MISAAFTVVALLAGLAVLVLVTATATVLLIGLLALLITGVLRALRLR